MTPNINEISSIQWAYITGLFDGEGCVYIHLTSKNKDDTLIINCKLIITNTNFEVLKWCQSLIGGNIIYNASPSRVGRGHKICYRLIIEQKYLIDIIPHLISFSIIKKEQLKLMFAFLQSRKSRTIGAPYNDFEIKCLFKIKEIIQGKSLIKIKNKCFADLEELKTFIQNCYKHYSRHIFEWTKESLKLLGILPDKEVASKLGISLQTVRSKREKLKIKSFKIKKTILSIEDENNIIQDRFSGMKIKDLLSKYRISQNKLSKVLNNKNQTYEKNNK